MTKGLGNPALRNATATTAMTAAEFSYLKAHPSEVPEHMRGIFEETLRWERRSAMAKRAAATKRAKYVVWPGRRTRR